MADDSVGTHIGCEFPRGHTEFPAWAVGNMADTTSMPI